MTTLRPRTVLNQYEWPVCVRPEECPSSSAKATSNAASSSAFGTRIAASTVGGGTTSAIDAVTVPLDGRYVRARAQSRPRHRRSHRPRKDVARPGADGEGHGSAAGGAGARDLDRA